MGLNIPEKKIKFYCTACDFYICMKCYKDYFFYIGREEENAVNVNMENKKVARVEVYVFSIYKMLIVKNVTQI